MIRGLINEASWDRAARVAIGLVLLVLGWSGMVAGGWGLFLKYFGFLPLVTGLLGWCPLYSLFGFSTCARRPPRGATGAI
jgi:hypothetical protein